MHACYPCRGGSHFCLSQSEWEVFSSLYAIWHCLCQSLVSGFYCVCLQVCVRVCMCVCVCQGKHLEVRRHPRVSILALHLACGRLSFTSAPGTPSNSSACCFSPFRDTLEAHMCVTVSGLMCVQGTQTQTIRFAQPALCQLSPRNSPFLGFLEVELTDSEIQKLCVPRFSELDWCRHLCGATLSSWCSSIMYSSWCSSISPQHLSLPRAALGPSPFLDTGTSLLISTIDEKSPNSVI